MTRVTHRVQVKIEFKWWVNPYIYGLQIVSLITGLEPGDRVVEFIVRHGVIAVLQSNAVMVA